MRTAAPPRRGVRCLAAAPLVAYLFLLVHAVVPGVALAAPNKRVAVHLRGKDAGRVAKQIVQVLKRHGFVPVPPANVQKTAKASHVGLGSDADLATVARKLKLAAIVVGDVRGARAQIRVHGADGAVIADGAWSVPGGARKLAPAVGRTVWSRIGRALEEARDAGAPKRARESAPSAAPAAAVETPPEPKPQPKASPPVAAAAPPPAPPAQHDEFEAPPPAAPPPEATKAAPSEAAGETESEHAPAGGEPTEGLLALDLSAGPRLLSRDLSWNKDLSGAMRPFQLANAIAIGFQAAWYPGAHLTDGWPAYLGVVLSGEYMPTVTAKSTQGSGYPTSESDYWGGVRGRLPLGIADVALTLGYGQHAAVLRSGSGSDRAMLNVPDMKLSYLRIGADGRVRLPANFALLASLGYRDVLDPGSDGYGIKVAFPRVTVTAIDVSAAVGYRFMGMLEARLGFDLRRYGFDMHPQPTDAMIVSGAIDQYLAFWLNLAVLLDGSGGRAP